MAGPGMAGTGAAGLGRDWHKAGAGSRAYGAEGGFWQPQRQEVTEEGVAAPKAAGEDAFLPVCI